MLSSQSSGDMMKGYQDLIQLKFSNLEVQRDNYSIVIRCNIMNEQPFDQTISSNYFLITGDEIAVSPHVSYVSDAVRQAKILNWKILKPNESCTIMLLFQNIPRTLELQFRIANRLQNDLIYEFNI